LQACYYIDNAIFGVPYMKLTTKWIL